MLAIYKKELRSYFTGMTGAIFAGFVLLIAGIYIAALNFDTGYAQFEYSISMVSFVYLPAIPVLTMRSLAEEKNTKTDQLLYTLPMNLSNVILAKYFAIITVLAIPLAVLGLIPLVMSMYGSVHFAVAYSALLITFLLGCALSAIGMFISSTTESQVIAAVVSIAVFFAFYIMNGIISMIPTTAVASMLLLMAVAAIVGVIIYALTKNVPASLITSGVLAAINGLFFLFEKFMIEGKLKGIGLKEVLWEGSVYEGLFAKILAWFDVFGRGNDFFQGIFDLSAVVYYLSIAVLFVFFTIQSMEKKRWSEVD